MTLFAWHCHLHVLLQEILLDSPGCAEKRSWILVEQQQSAAHRFFWSPPFSAAVEKMGRGKEEEGSVFRYNLDA